MDVRPARGAGTASRRHHELPAAFPLASSDPPRPAAGRHLSLPGWADDALTLDPVVVTGSRVEERAFDLPAAIAVVGEAQIKADQARVNASEALAGVPGVSVANRQNYAQDLQISTRGFGARSAFGVRGVRLVADGIPASMPDGQGQAATFNLDRAERLEVMRGPMSAVYGNSAGGVIQLFTRDGRAGRAWRAASAPAATAAGRPTWPPTEKPAAWATCSTPRASPPRATATTAAPSATS